MDDHTGVTKPDLGNRIEDQTSNGTRFDIRFPIMENK